MLTGLHKPELSDQEKKDTGQVMLVQRAGHTMPALGGVAAIP